MKQLLLLLVLTAVSQFSFGADWCKAKQNLNCMVAAINGEARGEGYNGMLMIGKTIATRMARHYKSSVCGVVGGAAYATKYSFPTKGADNQKANANIARAAHLACTMGDQGVTHFHSFRKEHDSRAPWSKRFSFVGKVGHHYFFDAPYAIKAMYEGDQDGDLLINNLQDDGGQGGELIQEPDYSTPGDDSSKVTVPIEI